MNWPMVIAVVGLLFVAYVIFVVGWSCFCDRPDVTLVPWEDDE